MKKKLITGLLLMAVTSMGLGTFTSCKDTDDDLRAELQGEQANLKKTLADLQTQINGIKPCTCVPGSGCDCTGKPCDCSGGGNAGGGCSCDVPTKEEIESWIDAKVPTQEEIESWFEGKIPTQEEIDAWIDAKVPTKETVDGWIDAKTADFIKKEALSDLESFQQKLEGIGIENLTAQDVTKLIAIAAEAEQLVKDSDLSGINSSISGLNTTINTLKGIIYGDDSNAGLVSTVDGLGEWFKDINLTPAQFQDYVKQGLWVSTHKQTLELVNQEAIQSLNSNYKGVAEMYNKLFPNGTEDTEWWNYSDVLSAIQANQSDIDKMMTRINDMVTSLVLQSTVNPVFGALNTPFGVNSMVLMAFYGNCSTGITRFPANGVAAEYTGKDVDVDWAALTKGNYYEIQNENLITLNEQGKASLGTLWFTVNPGTVDNLNTTGFALVNSADQVSPVSLTSVVKDDETVFKFGVSRAAGNGNGLYSADATVSPDDLDAIKININSGLKNALIDAVKNRTATDIAKMFKAIYNQLQDVCDANALRYTWASADERENKVYSNYGIAATAFKPLSFSTLYGESFRHLPTFGTIEIGKELVNLNLKPFEINGDKLTLDLQLKIDAIEINGVAQTVIKVKVPAKFDVDVDTQSGEGAAVLPTGWDNMDGYYSTVEVNITEDLQKVVTEIQNSVNTWVLGDKETNTPGLADQINSAVDEAVKKAFLGEDGLITDMENQVNDMMGSIQNKLYSLVDQINNDYLGRVNSLINRVNRVSERINKVLDDPNHYLQAAMLYQTSGSGLGILSTDKKRPSQFKGNGEAIELWATTYSFETVCPAFKKFVGVTKVTKNGTEDCPELADAANNSANFMATVLDGRMNRVALDVKGATHGTYLYEIAYQALDYSGHTSTVKCYVQVVRP